MSAQRPDMLTYRRRQYAVTAVEGDGLFDPASHGLDPKPTSTGCYRGTICHYVVRRKHLVLDRLDLGSDGRPPELAGVEPEYDDYEWTYPRVGLAIAFTGRMLVGRGDVDGTPYLNMGFWPAWMYAEVYELAFAEGVLTSASDVSAAIATVRDGLGDGPGDGLRAAARPAPGEPTPDWINRTFSLTFDYSWPGNAVGRNDPPV